MLFRLTRYSLLVCCFSSLCAPSLRGDEASHSAQGACARCAHFVVRSYPGGPSAPEVLRRAQELRQRIAALWLGEKGPAAWSPRCEVVIHPTRTAYLRAVGRGGGQTSGSSLVQSREGRIIMRRVDLVVDARGELSALAHELTHVVMADRFAGRQPPRWLDEGIALLSDSRRKQSLHHRDCCDALDTGTALRLAKVLSLDRFTSALQVAPFYGQSHSLVKYLAGQADHETLIAFAEAAIDQGYDRALSQYYAINGVADLERRWRAYARSARSVGGTHLLISTVR